MKRFFLLLIVILGICFIETAVAQEYLTERDISYSTSDEYATERCRLDVYHPTDRTGRYVVVWFHGGGLTGGERFIPSQLTDKGLVVVAVNYRLMPRATIDDCIDDAAAAVAWTFRNIEQYGGDTDKIIVSGHSAGGYLTSMIGLDKRWLAKYGIDADRIAALVPYSGQAITHFACRRERGVSELQPLIDEYAPLYHIRPDAAPYIIITGDRNQEMFGRYEESAYMWRMMQLVGHPHVELYELDGYDHGAMAEPAHHILLKTIERLERGEYGGK